MLGLEAIGKNGYNSSIIIKTSESNVDEYNEFILNEIDKFDNEHPDYNVENDFDLANDFCKMILKRVKNMDLKSDNDWFDDNFNVEKLLKQAKEVSELNKQIDKEKLKEFYKKQKD